jgi:sterol desaturase/sphingolipid hydroxylase (fatty acid hydroxylase superfamily)
MTQIEPVPALPDAVALAVPAFVILVLIELFVARFAHKGRYETRDSAASLSMGLGNLIVGLMTRGAIFAVFMWIYESGFRLFDIPFTWWAFVLCFFAEDLTYYWNHRIAHERRWFWQSHVVHHSSQHYNLTTALRQTWTGWLDLSWGWWLVLVLIGFHPVMIFFFKGVSLVYQFWIHTEAIKRIGPLEWVLNTPSHHRVHHATNPRYLDSNYAGVLIIWDRMFGTFVPETDEDPPRYGLVSNLATFNPLRIALHETIGIVRDVGRARSLKEVMGYVFGPPGWSPDGSRKTSAMLKAEWRARTAQTKARDATPAE